MTMKTYNGPFVTVVNAPGFEDRWQGWLIATCTSMDDRPLAVIEAWQGEWHVIGQEYVRMEYGE